MKAGWCRRSSSWRNNARGRRRFDSARAGEIDAGHSGFQFIDAARATRNLDREPIADHAPVLAEV